MYLCLCHGVSDKVIRELMKQGDYSSLRQLQKKTKAGTNCGACVCDIKEIVQGFVESNDCEEESCLGEEKVPS